MCSEVGIDANLVERAAQEDLVGGQAVEVERALGISTMLLHALAMKYSRSPPYSRNATAGLPDLRKSRIASWTSCTLAQYGALRPAGRMMTPWMRLSTFALRSASRTPRRPPGSLPRTAAARRCRSALLSGRRPGGGRASSCPRRKDPSDSEVHEAPRPRQRRGPPGR